MDRAQAIGLLVSVRDADEATAALAGGATLIDVKEPSRGPLGRADDSTIASVVNAVAGRVPVSAALGELGDEQPLPGQTGLAYIKWGLAGCQKVDWRGRLSRLLAAVQRPEPVVVAYADWQCAQAPAIDEVVGFACSAGRTLLIDTFCKEAATLGRAIKPTLLDWLPVADITVYRRQCREHGVRIALAGSLDEKAITTLAVLRPDWFAVRGAACGDSDRHGGITVERVRRLSSLCSEL